MKTCPTLLPDSPVSGHSAGDESRRLGRVLVAEDEAALRRLTVLLLRSSGYAVVGVEDGEAAWDALNREPFDLVVTDHCMPRLSGLELLERLRNSGMDVPVIMVSGTMPAEALSQHPWLHLHNHLAKPYTSADLLRCVAAALDSGSASAASGPNGCNWFEHPELTAPSPR